MEAIREKGSVSNVNYGRTDTVAEPDRRAIGENIDSMELAVKRSKEATDTNTGYTDVDHSPENEKEVQKAISALEALQAHHPETTFQYSVTDSGKIQVKLLNFKTGELVEEIPSKKLLEFTKSLEELTGLVMEKRA